jgi:hypothetical protein
MSGSGQGGAGGAGGTAGAGGAGGNGGDAGAGGSGAAGDGGASGGGAAGDGGQGGDAGSGAAGDAGMGGSGNAGSGAGGNAGSGGQGAGGNGGGGGVPVTCGNGTIESPEACDGTNLGGLTCPSATGQTGATGTLACRPDCSFDLSTCHFCGDSTRNGSEVCDGPDLGGATCQTVVSPDSVGTLDCKSDCTLDLLDCSAPSTCNGMVKDPSEACDGTDFGTATCSSAVGQTATGTLQCTTKCTIDTAKCAYCGDGAINGAEACDGATFGAATCASATFTKGATGTLKCTPTCQLDTSDCTFCGNSIREAAESCDGSDLNGATCATVLMKPATGALGCAKDCSFDTAGCAYCGDGVINGSEQCEGAKVNGLTCATVVGTGSVGALKCTASCGFDVSGCTAPTGCGDGVKNGTDQCDGSDLGGANCALALGKVGVTGTLSCKASCTLDTSQCFYCGDEVINGSEVCDGVLLGSQNCASATGNGSAQGTLKCAADCSSLDTSGCYFCGDGTKNGSEKCDGADLGGQTCSSVLSVTGASGALGCMGWCAFDTSGCQYCGDGSLNNGEVCDGANFGTATCTSLVGFGSAGALKCAPGCGAIDTSGCSAAITCGDGTIDPMKGEDCDGSNLGGATCASATGQATATGVLFCSNNCKFNLFACQYCGNNIKDPGEACDGFDLAGQNCGTGFVGTPQCSPACQVDTSTCLCLAPRIVCTGTCLDPMADAKNCGACGHSCGTGSCSNGTCLPTQISTGSLPLTAYVVDTSFVYVVTSNAATASLLRIPPSGGVNVQMSAAANSGNLVGARYMAQDANNLYVAGGGNGNNQFRVSQYAKASPYTFTLLGTSGTGTSAPTGFCLSGSNNLFLTTSDNVAISSAIWLLHPGMASSQSVLFSIGQNGVFHGSACSSSFFYTGRLEFSSIETETAVAGPPKDIIPGQTNLGELTTTATNLIWTIQNPASVWGAGLDGSMPKKIYSPGSGGPSSVVADSGGIYWSDQGNNTINFIKIDGTGQRVVATSPNGNLPTNLQLDAQYVYFLTHAGFPDAALFRVAR